MRIQIRTSKWAIWSRRLFSLALPIGVFAVLLHRLGQLSSNDFLVLLGVVWGIAVLAILFALIAFVRLWYSGDRGWGRAVAGLLGSIALLAPLALAAVLVARTPFANDVTTAAAGTPALRLVDNPDAHFLSGADVTRAFPGAAARIYTLSATDIFNAAQKLVEDSGWDIRFARTPATDTGQGEIDAVATTWLGWRDEIVIAVVGTSAGTRVDMRSASFVGRTDLGTNGRRIADFLKRLDERVGQSRQLVTRQVAPVPQTKSGS